jgi:hypothetical protein
VGVPQAPELLDRAIAEAGVWAVRVAFPVRELVVLAMVGNPGQHVAFHRHLAEHGERVAHGAECLERAVREEPVEADGHAHAGREVAEAENPELGKPDHPVPEQRDRDRQPDEREDDARQVDHLVRAAQPRHRLIASGRAHVGWRSLATMSITRWALPA